MMNSIRHSSPIFLVVFILLLGFTGCKSKKKAMEAQAAAEKTRLEQEAADRRQKEEAAKKEAEETARREAEAKQQREAMANTPKTKLTNYFNAISNSSNVSSANTSINEALSLFASPETPVLIVISEEAGQKDYDRPTTIRDYLNYLKDQKKNINQISNLELDSTGKITTLELRKN
jgi:hypothetical protein